ncbi:MAG: T9SS type A sorting domain-containing protein [Bacteroidia bacterium]|nr:T9SS type A sorting domain-containing protein [Bacteroidia bacterium]
MKLLKAIIAICFMLICINTGYGQTILISAGDGGFENGATFAANGWTVVNGAPVQPNQWYCGATGPTGFTGARCAYVGTAATNNNYNNAFNVTHIYRNITFPAGEPDIRLYFRYKVRGRSNEDYMAVYVVPTTTTPTAGVILPLGQQGVEYRNQTTWINDSLILPCTFAGTTQRLVFSWVNDDAQNNNPAIAMDNISLVSNTGGTCSSLMGIGYNVVASLPYNSGPGTTCGFDDDITDADVTVCGNPDYYGDEDVVWTFTPLTSGPVSIDLNSPVGVATGLMLYDGCPMATCSGVAGTCVASAQDITGNKTLCVSVIAGHEYYLILDGDGNCNDYDNVFISAPNTGAAGTTCANPITIVLPFNAPNQSTACMGDDYNNSTSGSCMSLYESGEDLVYQYISSGNECIGVVLDNMSTSSMGFSVYLGCPGAGGTCFGSFGGSAPLISSITLNAAGTYYFIIDSWAPPASVSYDITITSYGNTSLPNEQPCGAEFMLTGVVTFGDNNCSNGAGEPATPGCWSATGTINTVWFSTVVPPSGNITISTQLITLSNTQIAVYSGTCNSLTQVGCNDNGSALSLASSLNLTGLTPGDTIFISVDGSNSLMGTFNILAVESVIGNAYNNQDCLGAINVCNPVISQPNSFFGPGLIEEIPAPGNVSNPSANPAGYNSGCLLSGERNIVWFSVHITSPGLLSWKLTHLPGCYDWIMYDLTNNTCQDILNNTLAPVRCNWNGACLTTAGMMNPVPPGSSPFDFQLPLPVVAGQTLVLALSNWSGTSGSFTLDFSSSTCGIGSSNALNWSGATNTAWQNSSNWGGCSVPACGINTNIFPATNQPVISTNVTAQNITILPGASLTINPNITLTVCGNFTNFGTLHIDPTSTILMSNGSVLQNFDGLLTASNSLGNVVITKTGGSVNLNSTTEIAGNLTTSNNNSILNLNANHLKVQKNIFNALGSVTFNGTTSGSTLEFNGSVPQTFFTNGNINTTNLILSHQSSGVTLSGGSIILDATGLLTLDSGNVITGTNEVVVNNPDPGAVVGGHATSFVQGNLRRALSGNPDMYAFPVGHATKGYQLAEVNFTTPTLIPNLVASFSAYPVIPTGPVTGDCFSYNYSLLPVLDNGYWSILPSANGNSGTYNISLYNTSYSPTANYATALLSPLSPPTSVSWTLSGTCVSGSDATLTMRNGMNGFGYFGVGLAVPSPLPIELITFAGKQDGEKNKLWWVTASEINSDFFILESSLDGNIFKQVATLKAAGNSNNNIMYEIADEFPAAMTYYRLKEIDYDGAGYTSEIISIKREAKITSLQCMPNPTANNLHIQFQLENAGHASLELYNTTGKKVASLLNQQVEPAKFDIETDLHELPKGVYYLILSSDISTETVRVVKL